MLLATALAAAAVALTAARAPGGADRLARLWPRPGRSVHRSLLSGTTACLLAGLGAVVLLGIPVGLLAGAAVVVAGPLALGRLEPVALRRDREQLVRDLPMALDLLAACLAGGASLPGAAAAVGAALPGPCGRRLLDVRDALAAGCQPGEAWSSLAARDPDDPLAAAARMLARAADGGTPVAAAVARLAAEARAVSLAAGAEAARRVGVLVVAPLGLCFLPAFVLLGIVPVVVGLAGPLLRTF
jgi:pilus assembly protein TadC